MKIRYLKFWNNGEKSLCRFSLQKFLIKYIEYIFVSLNFFFAEFFWHFHSFPSFLYPNNNAILLTRSKVWTKRRFLLLNNCSGYPHCATIHVYFHRFTCRFKSLLMYIGTDKSICIRVLLLKFPIQFPHTLFDVKSFILFLWQHRRKGGEGGKGNCIKLCPTRSYSRLRLRKRKKNIPPLFFCDFNSTITHPRKNLFKRDGEILQSINRLFPDKTLQVSLVNPSFRLKILSRIFLSLFPFFFSLSKKRVIVNCTKFPSPSHILSPSMIHIAKNSKTKLSATKRKNFYSFIHGFVRFPFLPKINYPDNFYRSEN